MPYVVARPAGRYEVRESLTTPKGPRSRTLATFRTLDEDVLDRAQQRATGPLDRVAVLAAARRSGAPIAPPRVDQAAARVLVELDRGAAIRPGLRRLLATKLAGEPADPADHHLERMLAWIDATPNERGEALRKLLALIDHRPGVEHRRSGGSHTSPRRPAEVALADKIEAIHDALERARLPHAFGGALALAYYAEPRAAEGIDLDVFVPADRRGVVLDAVSGLAVAPRGRADPKSDGREELAWGPTAVDISYANGPFHDAMRRDISLLPFGERLIPFLGAEHLVAVMAILDRRGDWLDIEQVLFAAGEFDARECRRWARHAIGTEDPRYVRLATAIADLRG